MGDYFFKCTCVWKRNKNKPELIPADQHCSRWKRCIRHNLMETVGLRFAKWTLLSGNHELRRWRRACVYVGLLMQKSELYQIYSEFFLPCSCDAAIFPIAENASSDRCCEIRFLFLCFLYCCPE
jgi:hypothetical protein